ncbi:hypothetical protein DHEL01_v204195 [Diaporthe helianthi]|uniref:Uncharacterized protein n=1 Tax=Diaporthe helianthi TaxID=158607 RepID=A0A2P5I4K1_DIAHE|nr:hypothetical protein DHEL01_v204195 [Diaporthe helianthi]
MLFTNQALTAALLQALGTAALSQDPTLVGKSATPARQAVPPENFTADPSIGSFASRGDLPFTDSPHFRVYNATGRPTMDSVKMQGALDMLEAAYSCFVDTLGWRSTGLSFWDDAGDDGPWNKTNLYSQDPPEVTTVPSEGTKVVRALGVDDRAGMIWLGVIDRWISEPNVTIAVFGRGLTYQEKYLTSRAPIYAWAHTVGDWVADTYMTSPLCADSRSKYSQPTYDTTIDLNTVIGRSFKPIVAGTLNSSNHNQAWPFLSFLTYNPDKFRGLGTNTVRDFLRMCFEDRMKAGKGVYVVESPLNYIARLSTSATIQQVVGRYWARMAYVDIGHPTAQSVFLSQRAGLDYSNLDSQGDGVYRVKAGRQPKYMGSNIIPLKTSGAGNVTAMIASQGSYTATLAVRDTSSGASRYVDFSRGSAWTLLGSSEEASVVVAHTPGFIDYDPFNIGPGGGVDIGLDYNLTLTGATA